jgi:hypothetical protein
MVGWSNYLWVLLLAALAILLRGFIGQAAKDLYTLLIRKIWPADPEPVKIGRRYEPMNYAADSLVWVNEDYVKDKLSEGYSHYLDPSDGARRYRIGNPSGAVPEKEFYMLKPNAQKLDDTD